MYNTFIYKCELWIMLKINFFSNKDVHSLNVFVWLKWGLMQGECYQHKMWCVLCDTNEN
jgi:hypothetical protein